MPRDLTVRVRADVGAYQKAMSAAAASTDELAQSGLRLQKMGLQISNIGDNLTKHVTLPLAIAGGAAVKMATDFDNSFTRMQTLAGVSSSAVDGLKESVLDLSGETGRAPQELAEALYFLQSSGLDSADAMDALEMSAKGSAVGLGDTATVADAVSSAMLAYADAGLTAAEATDVLVATAKAGKVEPAELATQMGRLLPVASELGITFDQVGGSIALLSRMGNNAEQSTTLLVNVMTKLLKPSQQAAEQLDAVGLSIDDLHAMIAEQGLIATLENLRSILGDNGFAKFMEDQQAVLGALSLTNASAKDVKEVMDALADSAGATDNAFGTWAESMGAKNARAFADFQVALIRIGDALAPIASSILDFAAGITDAFSSLPSGAQQAVIAIGFIAAAIGPLLSITGRLITGVGTAIRLLESLALPAGTVSGAFSGAAVSTGRFSTALAGLAKAGLIVGTITALVVGLKEFADRTDDLQLNVGGLTDALFSSSDAARKGVTDFVALMDSMGRLDGVFEDVLKQSPEAAEQFIRIAEAAGVSGDKINEMKSALEEKKSTDASATAAQSEYNAEVQAAAGVTEEATSALKEYADALAAQFDPLFGMVSALQSSKDAQIAVTDTLNKLTEAQAGSDPTAIAEAQRSYEEALQKSSGALYDVQQAQLVLNDAIQRGDVDVAGARQSMYNWAIQAGYTADQAAFMAGQLGGAADAAAWLGQQDPVVSASTTGVPQVEADLNALKARTDAIPREINIVTRMTQIVAGSTNIPLRAHGGSVMAGHPYIVGERHAELFVPDVNGTIVPNVPMTVPAPAGSGWGGGATLALTVQVNNPIVASEREFQRMVTSAANRGLASGEINLRGRRVV